MDMVCRESGKPETNFANYTASLIHSHVCRDGSQEEWPHYHSRTGAPSSDRLSIMSRTRFKFASLSNKLCPQIWTTGACPAYESTRDRRSSSQYLIPTKGSKKSFIASPSSRRWETEFIQLAACGLMNWYQTLLACVQSTARSSANVHRWKLLQQQRL